MRFLDFLLEAVIDYNLDNYTTMPRFTDTNMGRKYNVGDKAKLKNAPNEKISRIYNKYRPGTVVNVLGRLVSTGSTIHYIVVNPEGTNEVYKIYAYYLQDPDKELMPLTPRLKKVLKGNIKCGNCGSEFSLDIPGGRHRDHCPHCLHSVHIDNRPGDRNAWCGSGTHDIWTPSILVPVGKSEIRGVPSIVYQCEKCKAIKINKYAPDDNGKLISKLPTVNVLTKNRKNSI